MIHGIHGNAAIVRTLSQPAGASRLADGNVLVIEIAYLTDRGHAILGNFAGLARRQLNQRIFFFLSDQLRRSTRRAHHLTTLARLQFHIVDLGAGRDIAKRQRVANENVGLGTADNFLSNLQTFGLKNVALLPVGVGEESDPRRAVGIVLDTEDGGRNAGLVALEIDNAQLALVAAADETHGHVAGVAATAGARLGLEQRLVRVPRRNIVIDDGGAVAQGLGCRSICLDCHKSARNSVYVAGCLPFAIHRCPIDFASD